MNNNYLNTSQYAVFHSPPGIEEKGWANVRGYGTVTFGSVNNDNITKASYVWNRLQPLNKPFGQYPPNCNGKSCQPSSESTLAWGCQKPQSYDDSIFQIKQ
jgi:hypothetical protein